MSRNDRAKDRVQPRLKPPLTADAVETILVTMLRSRAVRAEACRVLEPGYFRADERPYAILSRVLAALADEFADVDAVPYLDLRDAVDVELTALGLDAGDDVRAELMAVPARPGDLVGLLHHAYEVVAPGSFTVDRALRRLKDFAVERGLDQPYKQAMLLSGASTVANYAEFMAQRQSRMEVLATVAEDPVESVATFTTGVPVVATVPTRITFIDHVTDGGLAAGEVYGITGGTGWGKSTLAHQIALALAQTYQGRAAALGEALRHAVVFSYEDASRDIWARSLAAAARILRTTMEHLTDPAADLAHARLPYEAALARAEGKDLDGYPTEIERYRAAREWMAVNYRWIDMTKPGRGDGGVDEVVDILRRQSERSGCAPGLVVVDSIDLLAENWLDREHTAADAARLLATAIPRLVHRLKKRVAVALECSLIITNQFAGAVLKKSAGATLHHSDAGGSKSWAKPLNFHWALGPPNADKVSKFACSKGRRGGHDGDVALIRLEGEFGRWACVDHIYTVHNGEIVPRSVVDSVQGPARPRTLPRTSASDFPPDIAGVDTGRMEGL